MEAVHIELDYENGEWTVGPIDLNTPALGPDEDGSKYMKVVDAAERVCAVLDDWNTD